MTASNSRWLAAILALAVPVLARAEPPSPPTEAQIDAARALYREARELHRQGKLKEAIDRAMEAYRTAATPVTALEAGELLVEAGRLVEARDLVRSVALLPVSPRESDKGREARRAAVTLAASLDGRIPKIAVADRPADVEVLLDGKAMPPGDANAWQGVDPGAHTIVARMGDRTCTTITTSLAEGEERTIDLHGAAASCNPSPIASATMVATSPAASVAVPSAIPQPPTSREVPPARDAAPRWAAGAVASVGVVAAGVGGALGIAAKVDYDSVAAQCPPRGCTQGAYDARQSARSRADIATVTMIVGGAVALGGAVWFFWPRPASGPRAGAAVGVAVGLQEVRLGVRW